MKRAVRILTGGLAFLSVLFAVCLLLAAIGWPVSAERMQELVAELRRMPAVLIILIAAFVLGGIGVFVMYGLISERMHRRTTALLEKTALGETAVSFPTLAQIAERVVKARSDVSSCKTKVYAIGNDIKIDVRVVTSPTVSLVELTRALQESINASVTEICGTAVGDVNVTVDQAEIPPKKS